ncbi:hypothetical protein M514_10363, partial [Trichuris suis]
MKHLRVHFVLVMFIPMWLSEGGPTSCPSDGHDKSKKYFGWSADVEKGKECYTFLLVHPNKDYDPTVLPNKQFRRQCGKIFKKGFIFPIKEEGDTHRFTKEMLTYSGVTIKYVETVDRQYYKYPNHYLLIWRYTYEYETKTTTVTTKSTRSHGSEESHIYGPHLHNDWKLFASKSYDSALNYGFFPKCTFLRISHSGVRPDKVMQCADMTTLDSFWILCAHSAYDDCVEEKVSWCAYINRSTEINGWYKSHYRIKVPNEPPFGRKCEHYYDHGEQCKPDCKGSWSEWTAVPPKCAKGGKFTRRRFQARAAGDNVHNCDENNKSCCQMTTEITMDDCYDFDEDLTVKLDASKCQNDGRLIKTSTGYNKCECASGFKGVQCETNACAGECKNLGTCIVQNVGVLCICLPGFTGAKCEVAQKLCGTEKAMCENGGSCQFSADGKRSFCRCPTGYGGDYCAVKTEYCKQDTCSNAGVCHNVTQKQSFYCRCNAGRTGKKCEVDETGFGHNLKKFAEGESPIYIYVAIGIIVTLLFLTCGTGTVVHHRRRRRRRGGHRGNDASSYSSAFSSRFASTLSRFSTTGGSKATSRMSTKTTAKSLASKRGTSRH